MERLLTLLGSAVQFAYTCWDRIVLSGYIERLQRPENLIYFFHDVVGINAVEPAVLEQRTTAYKAWVRRVWVRRASGDASTATTRASCRPCWTNATPDTRCCAGTTRPHSP